MSCFLRTPPLFVNRYVNRASQPRALVLHSRLFLKVRTLDKPNPLKATYTVIHMFVVLLLASVPSFILNLPVGIVAR